jgi:Flp pilus assembly pilin Flp
MMRSLIVRLWSDDQGALLSIEFLLIATVLLLGLIVGLADLRNAVVTEFEELANAVLALSQGYSVSGLSGAGGSVDGSQAIWTPAPPLQHQNIPPAFPSLIDVTP